MPELSPRPAFDGLGLPLAIGGATLAAAPEAPLCEALALGAPLPGAPPGLDLPEPGRAVAWPDGAVAIWAGLGRWLVRGAPAEALARRLGAAAAVVDQSDGWAGLVLNGPAARDVLARLLPLDLDPAAFPPGSAARSALRQTPCLVLAAPDGFGLLVPRSYAGSAVADLAAAMRALAARAAISG